MVNQKSTLNVNKIDKKGKTLILKYENIKPIV